VCVDGRGGSCYPFWLTTHVHWIIFAFNMLQEYIGSAGWWHATSSDCHCWGAPGNWACKFFDFLSIQITKWWMVSPPTLLGLWEHQFHLKVKTTCIYTVHWLYLQRFLIRMWCICWPTVKNNDSWHY